MPVENKSFGGHDNKKIRWGKTSNSAAIIPDGVSYEAGFCTSLSQRKQPVLGSQCAAAAAHYDFEVLRGGSNQAHLDIVSRVN